MISKLGQLVEYITACAQQKKGKHATPGTPVFVREGEFGPMRQISKVMMGEDQRGLYVVLVYDSTVIQ